MSDIFTLINDFYDNVSIEYSKYHNEVTSPSAMKALFKKVDNQQIINKYSDLLSQLEKIKEEAKK